MAKAFQRFSIAIAAALLLGCLPVAAMADTVSYHVVVFFTSVGTNSAFAGAAVAGIGGSGFTELVGNTLATSSDSITANNEAYAGLTGPFAAPDITGTDWRTPLFNPGTTTPSTFGNFTVAGTAPDAFGVPVGARIEIDVYQDSTSPPSGGSDSGSNLFVGSATAKFIANGNDGVSLQFDSPTSFILPTGSTNFPPAVQYRLQGTQGLTNIGSNNEIRGDLTEVVPLPATASTGVLLMVCFAAFGVFRSRKANVSLLA